MIIAVRVEPIPIEHLAANIFSNRIEATVLCAFLAAIQSNVFWYIMAAAVVFLVGFDDISNTTRIKQQR